MEVNVTEISLLVEGIRTSVDKVRASLLKQPITRRIKKSLDTIENLLVEFSTSLEVDSLDIIVAHAAGIANHGQALSLYISEIDSGDINLARSNLLDASINLIRAIDSLQLTPNKSDENKEDIHNFISGKLYSHASITRQVDETKKKLNEYGTRLSDFENNLKGLEHIAATEIQKITKSYEAAKIDIDEKTNHINRVTGQAAARMIAGDYEGSAASEKLAADNLRYFALACMLLIVGVLGWAVFESTSAIFEWERFLSKISLVFLLGVPAAYLARESAKHREQQYHHLQTSLDMKAISPFLASLPDDEQHKLKALIATRIFGGRDFSKIGNDPYPLNTQEIIMKIIEKADFSNKPAKRTDDLDSR